MLSIDQFATRFQRAKLLTHGLRGNIDTISDDAIIGWIAPLDGNTSQLRVGLFAGNKLLAQTVANIFRADLRDAGIGGGYHGFRIPTMRRMFPQIAAAGGKVTVRILSSRQPSLGRLIYNGTGDSAALSPPPGDRRPDTLANLLAGDISALCELLAKPATAQLNAPVPNLTAAEKIFADQDYLPDRALPAPLCAYAEYVRYRYRQDEAFDLSAKPETAEHFLNWYLAGYSPLREGLRVPMSHDMLSYYNAPVIIGGKSRSLTRAHWQFLMGVTPILHTMDFDNPDWFEWSVYWWAIHQAHALGAEDCLVPDQYVLLLASIPAAMAAESVPLSAFLVRLAKETAGLQELDLTVKANRMTVVVTALAMAARRPDFLRYIPAESLCAAFESPLGGPSPLAAFLADLNPAITPPITQEQFARALRGIGFDLGQRRFDTITASGHRAHAAMLPRPQETAPSGLQIIGPFEKASGLGQATRLSASALSAAQTEANLVDFDLDNPAPEGFSTPTLSSPLKRAQFNLLHLNAESIPLAFAYLPDVFTGAYNIGYFFWELDSPAACHHLGMDLLDEIWVSSEYGVEIFAGHTDKPVINVGMCFEKIEEIDRSHARAVHAERFGIAPQDFVFLVAFDSFSFVQRKNPVGTLKAFSDAFPNGENVHLIIKTQNRAKVRDPYQMSIWEEIDRLIAQDKRIHLIDETLSYTDLLRLKKGSDCYVSLHTSEGWGFGIIEAMGLGVPVLCTGYSGNMDFCSDETAWLVDYDLVELAPKDYIFVREGQKWARPDIADAATQMRRIFECPDTRATKAEAAREFVHRQFSPQAIGSRYRTRLDEIESNLAAQYDGLKKHCA